MFITSNRQDGKEEETPVLSSQQQPVSRRDQNEKASDEGCNKKENETCNVKPNKFFLKKVQKKRVEMASWRVSI